MAVDILGAEWINPNNPQPVTVSGADLKFTKREHGFSVSDGVDIWHLAHVEGVDGETDCIRVAGRKFRFVPA